MRNECCVEVWKRQASQASAHGKRVPSEVPKRFDIHL